GDGRWGAAPLLYSPASGGATARMGGVSMLRTGAQVAGSLVGALALLLAPWLPAATALAATWYVDAATGNDANDCRAPATPCRSVGAAIAKAAAGDTINVAAGTYRPTTVTIARSLTLTGAGAGLTALDGDRAATVVTVAAGVTAALAGMTVQ